MKSSTFLIGFLFMFPALTSIAQSTENTIGSWNILNIKYAMSDKWSFFGEGQIRSLKFYDDFHYYEYKGGVDDKLFPNMR